MIYIIGMDNVVKGILNNDSPKGVPFWDDLNTESIENGMDIFEFKCPADNEVSENITVENYVAIEDADRQLKLFKVREIQTTHNPDSNLVKHVFAESVALELLKTALRPRTFTGEAPYSVLTSLLDNTIWLPGRVEVLDLHTVEYKEYPNIIEAILKLADETNSEVKYRVELVGGRIVGRYVDLLQRRGHYTGKRFTYSKDVLNVTRTEDTSRLYTAIVGIGPADENGNPHTMKGVSGTYVNENGTTITKGIDDDFIGDPDALQRWSSDGQHMTGVLPLDDTAPITIMQKSREYLAKHTVPKMKYEVSVVLLENLVGGDYSHEKVRIGDTLVVEDLMFSPPLVLEARVVEHSRSISDPFSDSVVLGNFTEMESNPDVAIAELISKVRRNEGEWDKGEDIAKSPTAPANPKVDDIWIDTGGATPVMRKYTARQGQGAGDPNLYTTEQRATVDSWIAGGTSGVLTLTNPNGSSSSFLGFDISYYKSSYWWYIDVLLPEGYTNNDGVRKGYVTNSSATKSLIGITSITFQDYKSGTSDSVRAYVEYVEDGVLKTGSTLWNVPHDAMRDYFKNLGVQEPDIVYSWEIIGQRPIPVQGTAPTSPDVSQLWVDTSVTPNVTKRWDGTSWITISATSLSELGGQLTSAQIAVDSITTTHIAPLAIDTTKIGDGVITNTKLAALAVDASKLTNSAVTAEKIANLAVGTAAIAEGAITNAKIANLDAGKITTGSLDANRLTAQSITADKIASNAITSDKIAANVITSAMISTAGLDAGVIQFGTMSGQRITAGSITADRLAVGSLSAITADLGNVTAGTIQGAVIQGSYISSQSGAKVTTLNNGVFEQTHSAGTDKWTAKLDEGQLFLEKITSNGFYTDSISVDGSRIYLLSRSGSGFTIANTDSPSIDSTAMVAWYAPVQFIGSMYLGGYMDFAGASVVNMPESTTNSSEYGFCGTGGVTSASGGTTSGTGVGYRRVKGYTPSQISLSASSTNAGSVLAININQHGFWLYITSAGTGYYYWRGYYSG